MLTVPEAAYPLMLVSLDAAGGAEQIVALLDRGLVSRGHRSIAIACAGSRTAGRLLPVQVSAPFDENTQRRARADFQQAIQFALRREALDLIHCTEWAAPSAIPDEIPRLPHPWGYCLETR